MSTNPAGTYARSTALALALVIVPTLLAAQQPRDARNEVARPETQREVELKAAAAVDPARLENWVELAKLQETRGAIEDAERTFKSAIAATVGTEAQLGVLTQRAGFYNRQGRFDLTIAALETAADLNPVDPAGHQLVATYYWEKAFMDRSISPEEKLKYLDAGIAATDRALAHQPDFVDALTFKNILLRLKANAEPDTVVRTAMLAEADALRNQAIELQKTQGPAAATVGAPGAPAPPPPPGAPMRVGGNIKTPTKIQHVSPVYPQEAQDAKVSGSVMTVDFDLNGVRFTALNGGPVFTFNEAVSFQIICETQDEVDYYWQKLTAGGDPNAQQCGWLKDKFGISWQVVPDGMQEMLKAPQSEAASRAMSAMMQMKKLDLNELKRAYAGK